MPHPIVTRRSRAAVAHDQPLATLIHLVDERRDVLVVCRLQGGGDHAPRAAILPPGQVDVPHRHSSAAINYYFSGTGWSIVGGQRYEWEAGDLMLSAPGWMPHGHAANDEDVLVLTIQDSPLQIALGSLLWMENIKVGRTEALGVTQGFRPDAQPATVS